MTGTEVRVGQEWRSNLGGQTFVVTGAEPDRSMFYVKRADSPRKQLDAPGGYAMAPFEFDECALVRDVDGAS